MRTLSLYFALSFFMYSSISAQPSRIELRSLYSPTLSTAKEFNILFPEGYDSGSDRYPVVYLFRGAVDEWADPTEDGSRRGTIKTVVDSLTARGRIGKMIYIMPGLGAPAPVNEYTYLVNDLIPYVDNHFRTIPDRWHRAMDGFSLGGLITTNLLSTVPHLFASVGSYDGTLSLFDNARFSSAAPNLIYSIKQVQLLYHTASVGGNNNSNNMTTFSILNSKGIFNTLPSFLLDPNAQHNWFFADMHMGLVLPLHWQKIQSAANSLELSIKDSITGKSISGQTSIHWSRKLVPNSIATYVFYSGNGGKDWTRIDSLSGNDSSAQWNTQSLSDGTRYRIKVLCAGDSLFGQAVTGNFTVNNPGNGAPDIEFNAPVKQDTLSGNYQIQWTAADADGDPLTVSIDISYNNGTSWKSIASSLQNNGQYSLDTKVLANGNSVLLKLSCSDGSVVSSAVSSPCILYNKRLALLNASFIHETGTSDAQFAAVAMSKENLGSANYLITINDTSGKKSYSVKDVNGIEVVSNATQLDGTTEGPLFNGFRLLIKDVPAPVIHTDSTRWKAGTSPLTGNVQLININLESETIIALPSPYDYEVRLTGTVSDTTLSLYGAPSAQVNFYIWNTTENRKTKFIFLELDGNGYLSRNDELYLFEPDSANILRLSWHLQLSGNEGAPDPKNGDIFMIKVIKPLTSKDTYRFIFFPPLAVRTGGPTHPGTFTLSQNYPNPFNPSTTIAYEVPVNGHVRLNVFDLLGREIKVLVNEQQNAGRYSVKFDGTHLSSGIYFARLTNNGTMLMRKMLLMK